ncbi:hypothetical protein [Alishewanella longhuensis]
METKSEDLASLLNQLDSQINAPEVDESDMLKMLTQLDAILLKNTQTLSTAELSQLKQAYENYLVWAERFVNYCVTEKQRIADELVLLQRRKNAKEQYQR